MCVFCWWKSATFGNITPYMQQQQQIHLMRSSKAKLSWQASGLSGGADLAPGLICCFAAATRNLLAKMCNDDFDDAGPWLNPKP